MADETPSTSTGRGKKRSRSEAPETTRKVYSDAEIQKLLDDLESSDEELVYTSDSESDGEDETYFQDTEVQDRSTTTELNIDEIAELQTTDEFTDNVSACTSHTLLTQEFEDVVVLEEMVVLEENEHEVVIGSRPTENQQLELDDDAQEIAGAEDIRQTEIHQLQLIDNAREMSGGAEETFQADNQHLQLIDDTSEIAEDAEGTSQVVTTPEATSGPIEDTSEMSEEAEGTSQVVTTPEATSGPIEDSTPSQPSTSQVWFTDPPPVRQMITFTGGRGLKTPAPETPSEYFELFFTPEFYQYLADEANDYAKYVIAERRGPRSRICAWKEVEAGEMKTFIGIVFLMGMIRINRINDCWKKHYLFNLSFPQFMSRDRYLLILRCLHFQKERSSRDPIYKIRPLMDYMNKKMNEICYPSRELTIDESMVLWRGRLAWRQFLPGKRHKYGMKLYVLAEPNGLVQKIHIYGGTKDADVGGQGHASKVVNCLFEGMDGKGHSLYMDNFYNSVELTSGLLEKQTYSTGTLRANRKGNPREVISKTLRKGESIARYTKDWIACCKWKDKRDVLGISSEHGGNMVNCKNKRGQESMKPKMIVEYNKYMKGVDRQDQMLSYYPITHKTLRYYKKLGIHVFHIMMNNSFFLYNKHSGGKKLDLHDFHLAIVTNLLPERPSRIQSIPSSIHLPEILPRGANNKTQRKRCKMCSKREKKRKDTIYGCPSCPEFPGLCLKPCFRDFHGYK